MRRINQEQWGDCDSLFLDHGGDVISSPDAQSAENLSRFSPGELA